tara:strand:+ start:333 stop:2093 length:1761 start_codon:yes stop_codon:yes gene_type:complete
MYLEELLRKKINFKKKVKKILLISTIQIHESKINVGVAKKKRYYSYPPYGLGILNKILKNNNFDSKILDLNIDTFLYLQNNDVKNNNEITKFWKERLHYILNKFNPDLVGITCTFTMNLPPMKDTLKEVKKFNNDIYTIAGGVHVTNDTENILKECPEIDFANTHEGEKSFLNFLNFLNTGENYNNISQLSWLENSKFHKIEKMDIPSEHFIDITPDMSDLPLDKLSSIGEIGTFRFYREKNSIGSAILSNKGCRARCSFCSVRQFNGKGVRLKSNETVVDEIKYLKNNYGVNHITWLDDDLFFDTERTIDLYKKISNLNFKITWDASNGIIASAAVAHPEIMRYAEESGCIGTYFGLESGSKKILASIHKPSGLKHYYRLGELMNEKHPKIFTRGFLIVGFPKESIGDIFQTIEMAKKVQLDWYTTAVLLPLPNTEIFNEMQETNIFEEDEKNRPGFIGNRKSDENSNLLNQKEQKDYFKMAKENPDTIPTDEDIVNLWYLSDYEMNYKPIFNISDEKKLKKKIKFLKDVSTRITENNPLAYYFWGLSMKKIGQNEGLKYIDKAKDLLSNSKGWQKRFETFNLEI